MHDTRSDPTLLDITQLDRVVVETYKFTKAFENATGPAPTGWATYFVNRSDKQQKPIAHTNALRVCMCSMAD